MRRAAKVDQGQAVIVDGLRAMGIHVTSLAAVGKGVPDLLVSHRGRWYVLEVKAPLGPKGGSSADGQRLGGRQEDFAAAARAPVHVVRSVIDALDVLGFARNRPQEARS